MLKIRIKCPQCGSINTMEDFCVVNHVMHERCSNCGHIKEMSLIRCLKRPKEAL